MPSIRLPVTLEPLLPFCRKSEEAVEHACFDTYADLVVFAASYGFYLQDGTRPSPPAKYLDLPYPIDLAIFRTQRSQLVLIGLATEGSQAIAQDEEKLCRLIEAFAEEGGKGLMETIKHSTPASFYLELANLLEEASSGKSSDQI